METLRLGPGVSVCGFDDCAIVLDLARDRYWQFEAPVAQILPAIARGACVDVPIPIAAMLLERELVTPVIHLGAVQEHAALPPATTSAIESGDACRGGLFTAFAVAAWTVAARVAVKMVPLIRLVGWTKRRRSIAPMLAADPSALARTFHHYRRLMPLDARCLPDTLAFLGFAFARGARPHFVMGVEAHPFAAHCWAQVDHVVLTDLADHARAFRPILTV